jgi:hypothetical protein
MRFLAARQLAQQNLEVSDQHQLDASAEFDRVQLSRIAVRL